MCQLVEIAQRKVKIAKVIPKTKISQNMSQKWLKMNQKEQKCPKKSHICGQKKTNGPIWPEMIQLSKNVPKWLEMS